ncbi:MAG: AAA family ATPase [Firmicutes bacterium]|nr:AAA family ATPase [Bacillota bacterium]
MNKQIIKEVKNHIKELKLAGISPVLEEKLEDAYRTDIAYEIFLQELLEIGVDTRRENGKKNRIRNAKFPYKKYLDDIVPEYLPEEANKRLKELKTLKFIEERRNVIFAGNPGTGKSHLAIGLGIHACNSGYKVLFATIPLLINELKEARSEKRLKTLERKFQKYDLIIADELGYISFDKEGSELLFTYLSLRAERKSTIITSNLSFNRWDEIFNDPVLTAAMVDRLTHKSYVINMNGNSYRTKETMDWMKQ